MNTDSPFKQLLGWYRLLERQRYIKSWSHEEALAYNNLSTKQKRRYDRRVHRWLDGKIDGPLPLIPGTEPRTRPSGDAYCTSGSVTVDVESLHPVPRSR